MDNKTIAAQSPSLTHFKLWSPKLVEKYKRAITKYAAYFSNDASFAVLSFVKFIHALPILYASMNDVKCESAYFHKMFSRPSSLRVQCFYCVAMSILEGTLTAVESNQTASCGLRHDLYDALSKANAILALGDEELGVLEHNLYLTVHSNPKVMTTPAVKVIEEIDSLYKTPGHLMGLRQTMTNTLKAKSNTRIYQNAIGMPETPKKEKKAKKAKKAKKTKRVKKNKSKKHDEEETDDSHSDDSDESDDSDSE
jgi:hypothetical protein